MSVLKALVTRMQSVLIHLDRLNVNAILAFLVMVLSALVWNFKFISVLTWKLINLF